MKKLLIVFIFLNVSTCCLYSQHRTISGKVIDDLSVETMPGVSIMINDTLKVGQTGLDGFFEIEVPLDEKKIKFMGVGMYPTNIELKEECNKIDVVMMMSGASCFGSLRRAERERKKRFKKFPQLHSQAFKEGIFETEYPCYNREFEPFYLDQ